MRFCVERFLPYSAPKISHVHCQAHHSQLPLLQRYDSRIPTWSEYLWNRSQKTWDVQYSVPLSGIFFIKQAEKDDICSLGKGETAALISESTEQVYRKYWRNYKKEEIIKLRNDIFNNACKMARTIPAFRLNVRLEGRFWEKIEEVI